MKNILVWEHTSILWQTKEKIDNKDIDEIINLIKDKINSWSKKIEQWLINALENQKWITVDEDWY
jgi:hypothetical protein